MRPVRIRPQLWHWALLGILLLCAVALAVVRWQSNRIHESGDLISLLPAQGAVVLFVNAAELRQSGVLDLLAGSKAAEEPEYRKFVNQVGFDYRTDLDAATAAFIGDSRYFALRGRFQWKRLSDYAGTQGGMCRDSICTISSGDGARTISFRLLNNNVLMVAVSADKQAVAQLRSTPRDQAPAMAKPAEPVWISLPGSRLAASAGLPAGVAELVAPLAKSREILLAAGPSKTLQDGVQFRLAVDCNSEQDAARLKEQLKGFVKMLGNAAGPKSLGQILAGGTFQQNGASVGGLWQIDRALLQSAASGTVP